jgi:hypothetical protein
MVGRHVNQIVGIRQGQLGDASQNPETSHPGNIKNALRPFSEAFDLTWSQLRRHTPSISPQMISETLGAGCLASWHWPRCQEDPAPRVVIKTPMNILLRVSWRVRPITWQGAGLGRHRKKRRRPAASLLLGRSLLGGSSLLGSRSGLRRGSFLGSSFGHWNHLVVQRHTCLRPTGMNRPVPAPIHTKSFKLWKRNFARNGLFFCR